MYTDDLIIITTATRKSAKNIKLCLNLYASLTSQTPNPSKSNLYFPYWFNRRVTKSIESILNIKRGNYPFTYLGILITYSSIMVMHVYYLSVYPVPDSILDRISASARKFLWANCSNGRGIPLVN